MGTPRVLVIDDDDMIRDSIIEFLDDNGYEASGAVDGRDALEKLNAAAPPPCVILLDLMMPVMDGRAFRERQRDDPHLAEIPVIVLSALQGLRKTAGELAAADCLAKPLRLQDLLRLLHKHCPVPRT
jgi:CheY-like chemotaxis protein